MRGRDLTGNRYGRLVALRPSIERRGGRLAWECRCDCGKTTIVAVNNLTSSAVQSCGCTFRRDLAGMRFGRLLVLERAEGRDRGYQLWHCRCDCGATRDVATSNLTCGSTKSCGCMTTEDLTGQRFGRLLVLSRTSERKHGCIVWKCQCDCGNTKYLPTNNLRKVISCGCATSEDLTGKRFGRLVVLSRTDRRKHGNVLWRCRCDCGTTKEITTNHLQMGRIRSCGCLHDELASERAKRAKPPKSIDQQRFGRLIALRVSGLDSHNNYIWECLCDCGATTHVRYSTLASGRTLCCGCLQRETSSKQLTKYHWDNLLDQLPDKVQLQGETLC